MLPFPDIGRFLWLVLQSSLPLTGGRPEMTTMPYELGFPLRTSVIEVPWLGDQHTTERPCLLNRAATRYSTSLPLRPVVPWAQNVHQHFSDLQQHLVDSFATAFPAAKSGCRSSHFSPYTWQLRQKRVWLRRHILALRPVVTLLDVRCAFVAWRRSRSLGTSCVIQALCCGRQVCDLAQCTYEIACTKKALRGAIRADVGARISDAAKDAATSATGDVVSRLQCLLGPSKRRARPTKGLPGILKPDGSPAETPAEVEEDMDPALLPN